MGKKYIEKKELALANLLAGIFAIFILSLLAGITLTLMTCAIFNLETVGEHIAPMLIASVISMNITFWITLLSLGHEELYTIKKYYIKEE